MFCDYKIIALNLDYVYFETSSTTPYQIRRVEELIKVGFALFLLI